MRFNSFKDWYSYVKKQFCIQEYSANVGWYNCKDQVLKILKDHPNLNDETSLDKAFKKIRKL